MNRTTRTKNILHCPFKKGDLIECRNEMTFAFIKQYVEWITCHVDDILSDGRMVLSVVDATKLPVRGLIVPFKEDWFRPFLSKEEQ